MDLCIQLLDQLSSAAVGLDPDELRELAAMVEDSAADFLDIADDMDATIDEDVELEREEEDDQ